MLTNFSKKILLILIGGAVLASIAFVLFWKKGLFATFNKQSAISTTPIPQTISTTTDNSNLLHISSSTNIIEMFGITKDTNATITQDVILDWVKDGVATQTLAKIIISVPERLVSESGEKEKAYGELQYGDYIIKWLNYSIDTKLQTGKLNELYQTGMLSAFDTKNNIHYVLYNYIYPYGNPDSLGIYYPQISADGSLFSYIRNCPEFCKNNYLDKNLNEVASLDSHPSDVLKSNENYYFIESVGGIDSKEILSKVSIKNWQSGKFQIFNLTDLKNFNHEYFLKLGKVENNKVYFDIVKSFFNLDKNKEEYEVKESYYYDEKLDKVVKIK